MFAVVFATVLRKLVGVTVAIDAKRISKRNSAARLHQICWSKVLAQFDLHEEIMCFVVGFNLVPQFESRHDYSQLAYSSQVMSSYVRPVLTASRC